MNVIYDNETTLVELLAGPYQQQQQQQPQLKPAEAPTAPSRGKLQAGFVDHDQRGEETAERDNFATCQLEPVSASNELGLVGRLNFWQPILNRGVMHLVARVRYTRAPGQSARRRRESFQAPVERAPAGDFLDALPLANVSQLQLAESARHLIWLADHCGPAAEYIASGATADKLVAEVASTSPPNGRLVDIDAESFVSKFNLTGANSLMGRCLVLMAPANTQGDEKWRAPARPLGHCTLRLSDGLPPPGELEHLPSVSVVQPVREGLLMGQKVGADEGNLNS